MSATVLITVTYGSRAMYVEQMLHQAALEGVSTLVVVDNGSGPENAAALLSLQEKHGTVQVHIIRHEKNLGSARGFGAGIQYAVQHLHYEYLWLLDDDNLPATGTLASLISFYESKPKSDAPIALQCMRKPGMQRVQDVVILQPANNFMNFHLSKVWGKVAERIGRKADKEDSATGIEAPIQIVAAPYGGFFMNKACQHSIGLPDEAFVLYMDDFEYTHRIIKQGGSIWLLPHCAVHDVEVSYHMETERKSLLYHSILDAKHDFRVYYSSRNTIFFYEKTYPVNNSFMYALNDMVFMSFITLAAILRGKTARLALMKQAIRDARNGKMGPAIPLP